MQESGLCDVTSHTLRHTFASVAGELGFSELTIAGLLGHSARGVTQGYVHLDTALIVAANQVAAAIAQLLDDEAAAVQRREETKLEISDNKDRRARQRRREL